MVASITQQKEEMELSKEAADRKAAAIDAVQKAQTKRWLKNEYGVKATFEPINVHTARWIYGDDREIRRFRDRMDDGVAEDHGGALVYLAPTRVKLQLTEERWPDITFANTREYNAG